MKSTGKPKYMGEWKRILMTKNNNNFLVASITNEEVKYMVTMAERVGKR